MTTTVLQGIQHGYAGYRRGCRCYVCGFAVSQYEQDRKRAIAAGTWQPYVDAAPVRQRLAELAANGIGYKQAAALAGLASSTVGGVIFGRHGNPPSDRVRVETATRILAVQVETATPADGQLVDGTGTARRIQALCAIGWSLTQQAKRIGWNVGNFAPLVNVRPVRGATARKVTAMYDQLSMTKPPASRSSSRACRFALERGWFPPLAWDDEQIDDPAAVPSLLPPAPVSDPAVDEMAVQHVMAGHPVPLPADLRDEVIRRLSAAGQSAAEIAPVVRTTRNTVHAHRTRLGLTRGRADQQPLEAIA